LSIFYLNYATVLICLPAGTGSARENERDEKIYH
jgi:hypothetical protein